MTPQEVADLRRTVRRLVEAASGEALEDARVLLEGIAAYGGELDPFVPQPTGLSFGGVPVSVVGEGVSLPFGSDAVVVHWSRFEQPKHEPRTPDGVEPTPERLAYLRYCCEHAWAINATHEEMRLAGIKGYGDPDSSKPGSAAAPPPTLAELAAARPRVTIPGRYCGDGHGVRIGRLVEDRDGMAQVQVDGFGVLNVPSGEVEQ